MSQPKVDEVRSFIRMQSILVKLTFFSLESMRRGGCDEISSRTKKWEWSSAAQVFSTVWVSGRDRFLAVVAHQRAVENSGSPPWRALDSTVMTCIPNTEHVEIILEKILTDDREQWSRTWRRDSALRSFLRPELFNNFFFDFYYLFQVGNTDHMSRVL